MGLYDPMRLITGHMIEDTVFKSRENFQSSTTHIAGSRGIFPKCTKVCGSLIQISGVSSIFATGVK